VGVWVGNSDNKSMQTVSGQTGAGRIWRDVMEIMYGSKYNKNTPFNFGALEEYVRDGNMDYGLNGDDYEKALNALKQPTSLITNPHPGDVFLYDPKSTIPLESEENVMWYVGDAPAGQGTEVDYHPTKPGTFTVEAVSPSGKSEKIKISFQEAE
jgi:membrane carboxypeptidase/penicillin-binding protein PbpC